MHINIFSIAFVIILALLIRGNDSKNSRRTYICVCSAVLLFIASMRSPEWTANYSGIDTVAYRDYFESSFYMDWGEFWSSAHMRYIKGVGDGDIGICYSCVLAPVEMTYVIVCVRCSGILVGFELECAAVPVEVALREVNLLYGCSAVIADAELAVKSALGNVRLEFVSRESKSAHGVAGDVDFAFRHCTFGSVCGGKYEGEVLIISCRNRDVEIVGALAESLSRTEVEGDSGLVGGVDYRHTVLIDVECAAHRLAAVLDFNRL